MLRGVFKESPIILYKRGLLVIDCMGGGGGGYRRHHGSLSGGGGAIDDTMGLFQGVVGL